MFLPKWGIGAALVSAAALVGCEQGGMNEIQDQQEDVIEAEQELNEEEAELNQAEEEQAIQDMENGTAQELNDSTLAPPPLPADKEMPAPANDPADGENPFATPPEPATPDPTTPSETTPEPASEAADDAGAAEGGGSNDPTAEETTPEPAPEN